MSPETRQRLLKRHRVRPDPPVPRKRRRVLGRNLDDLMAEIHPVCIRCKGPITGETWEDVKGPVCRDCGEASYG